MQVVWCAECGAEHWDVVERCAECGGRLGGRRPAMDPPAADATPHGLADVSLGSLDEAERWRVELELGSASIPFVIEGSVLMVSEVDEAMASEVVVAAVAAADEARSASGPSGVWVDPSDGAEADLGGAVRRLCAAAIDLLLLWLILSVAMSPLLADRMRQAAEGQRTSWVGVSLGVDLVLAAYFVMFAVRSGATVGKRLMGLRVVAVGGGAVGWRRAAARYGLVLAAVVVPELLDLARVPAEVSAVAWTTSLALVFMPIVLSDDGTGIHDRLSGTRVVRSAP